MQSIGMRKK